MLMFRIVVRFVKQLQCWGCLEFAAGYWEMMLTWTIPITDLISLSNSKSVLVRKEITSRTILWRQLTRLKKLVKHQGCQKYALFDSIKNNIDRNILFHKGKEWNMLEKQIFMSVFITEKLHLRFKSWFPLKITSAKTLQCKRSMSLCTHSAFIALLTYIFSLM